MINAAVEKQAKLYLFDLNNCAKEHWFKEGEGWEFSLATDAEKIAIEKKYKPTISTKAMPEVLLQVLSIVKNGAVPDAHSKNPEAQSGSQNHLQHLVAFNPSRLR